MFNFFLWQHWAIKRNLVVRKKGSDQQVTMKALDCLTNSLHHYHGKCMENIVENIHVDIRV